jgi:hypothetical protein
LPQRSQSRSVRLFMLFNSVDRFHAAAIVPKASSHIGTNSVVGLPKKASIQADAHPLTQR